jgi:hypothetical protein
MRSRPGTLLNSDVVELCGDDDDGNDGNDGSAGEEAGSEVTACFLSQTPWKNGHAKNQRPVRVGDKTVPMPQSNAYSLV